MRFLKSALVVLLLAAPASSHALSIGLFADPECGSCNLDTSPGIPQSFYVCIVVGNSDPLDVQGGSLRISGVPAEWNPIATPFPYVIAFLVTDPFVNGFEFGFLTKQESACIPVLTVALTPTTADEHVFTVAEHLDLPIQCPTLALESQMGHYVCTDGGTMFVNSSANCSVAVEESTWTSIKALFKS